MIRIVIALIELSKYSIADFLSNSLRSDMSSAQNCCLQAVQNFGIEGHFKHVITTIQWTIDFPYLFRAREAHTLWKTINSQADHPLFRPCR